MGFFDSFFKNKNSVDDDIKQLKKYALSNLQKMSPNDIRERFDIIHLLLFGAIDYIAQKHNKAEEVFIASQMGALLMFLFETNENEIADDISILFEQSTTHRGQQYMQIGAKLYTIYLNKSYDDTLFYEFFEGVKEAEREDNITENIQESFIEPEIKYYSNGNIHEITSFDENGDKKDYKQYYEDGTIMEEYSFKYDDIDGEYKKYYKNGKIESITNYDCGDRDKEYIYYYNNGNIKEIGYYHLNVLDKTCKQFSENGVLLKELNYEYGELDRKSIYYSNGNIKEIINYLNNEKYGLYKYYSENGVLLKELNYEYDELDGECKYYYDDGSLKAVGYYFRGVLDEEESDDILIEELKQIEQEKTNKIIEKTKARHKRRHNK